MRNRAKCKLCEEIIESFHPTDYVSCKCEEISIDGGQSTYKASFKCATNFLRVDDDGNEIIIKYNPDKDFPYETIPPPKHVKEELVAMLDEMRKRIEDLPQAAYLTPITHADYASLLMLLSAIFKAE